MSIVPISHSENHPWPVLGHATAVRLLKGTLSSAAAKDHGRGEAVNGLRQAYLFLGSQQIGKATLASVFAKFLLCTAEDVLQKRPCGCCRSCLLFHSGNHPDVRIIQPLDKTGTVDRRAGMLRVEQAADIIREAALSPVEGSYKCFVIQDVQTAHDSFSNKLLKTLEEPPPHVVLCLTALERGSVLPTIASRCQILELRPLDAQFIEKSLQKHWNMSSEEATLLSRLCNGRMGWAIQQIDSPKNWEKRRDELERLWSLTRADRVQRIAYADELATKKNQRTILEALAFWVTWWRDVLLAQADCLHACTNVDCLDEIQKDAALVSPGVVRQYIRVLRQLEEYLHHTTNVRLALDVMLLKLPSISIKETH